MLLAGVVFGFLILSLFLSMLGSSPKRDEAPDEPVIAVHAETE